MNIIKKCVVWIPVICIAVFIFGFSSQDGEQSGSLSREVSEIVVDIIDVFMDVPDGEYEIWVDNVQFPVRKAAHMTEYAVLFIFTYIAFMVDGLTNRKLVTAALILVVIFASSDEIHQLYVPDRNGCFTDVLVDTAGAFIGLIVCRIAGSIAGRLWLTNRNV